MKGYFLPVAIGFTVITSLYLHGAVAQTPQATPDAPQTPEAAPPEPTPSGSPESSSPEADSTVPAAPAEYRMVTGDDWAFAVPQDWQDLLAEPIDLGDDASLVAQVTDGQKQTIVNLVIQDYKGDNNDYIDQSVKTLADLGTVHAQTPITLSDWQGIALDFSLTDNDPPTRFLQRVIAANGTGFALTCGGREENFAATQPVCTTILNSLQIPPP